MFLLSSRLACPAYRQAGRRQGQNICRNSKTTNQSKSRTGRYRILSTLFKNKLPFYKHLIIDGISSLPIVNSLFLSVPLGSVYFAKGIPSETEIINPQTTSSPVWLACCKQGWDRFCHIPFRTIFFIYKKFILKQFVYFSYLHFYLLYFTTKQAIWIIVQRSSNILYLILFY